MSATLMIAAAALVSCKSQNNKKNNDMSENESIVYFTKEISPESLVKIYKALGKEATGRVAVKISTGEAGNTNYLKPELIAGLVKEVNGTIVECNTAYLPSERFTSESHRKLVHEHGFDAIAPVDLMDEEGDMKIPVQDTTWLKYDIVGKHLANYDFMINLAHFKGHPMGGLGGVLKNQSIGVASASGKTYIHTAGSVENIDSLWEHAGNQDGFLESMAAAAQAVHEYLHGNVIYIDVMNNMSVDCDCVGYGAAEPAKIADMGILASLDPVALDQACVDKVFNLTPSEGNDNAPLIERINRQHGIHTIEHAEKIGLGSRSYKIVDLDAEAE